MELTNCANCGAVFAKNVVDICPKCYREEEKAFEIVYKYLRQQKNRSAVLHEIAEATGVEEDLIIKFLKQNRLRAANFPQLKYPCESCGNPISEKTLCSSCSSKIVSDWGAAKQEVEETKTESELGSSYYIDAKKNKE